MSIDYKHPTRTSSVPATTAPINYTHPKRVTLPTTKPINYIHPNRLGSVSRFISNGYSVNVYQQTGAPTFAWAATYTRTGQQLTGTGYATAQEAIEWATAQTLGLRIG